MHPDDATVGTICSGDARNTSRIISPMDWTEIARARMHELGLSQADLMPVLEVRTRGAVGHYLNKRRSLSPDQMKALARKLNLSMDQLFGGSTAPADPPDKSHTAIHSRERLSSAIRVVRRALAITGTETSDDGFVELVFSVYDVLDSGAAQESAERIVSGLLRAMAKERGVTGRD